MWKRVRAVVDPQTLLEQGPISCSGQRRHCPVDMFHCLPEALIRMHAELADVKLCYGDIREFNWMTIEALLKFYQLI